MSYATRDRIHRAFQTLLGEISELGGRVREQVEPEQARLFEKHATHLVREIEANIRTAKHLVDEYERLIKYRRTPVEQRPPPGMRHVPEPRRALPPPTHRPFRGRHSR